MPPRLHFCTIYAATLHLRLLHVYMCRYYKATSVPLILFSYPQPLPTIFLTSHCMLAPFSPSPHFVPSLQSPPSLSLSSFLPCTASLTRFLLPLLTHYLPPSLSFLLLPLFSQDTNSKPRHLNLNKRPQSRATFSTSSRVMISRQKILICFV